MSLNVPKFLSSLYLQGLFYTFIGCDYHTQSNALNYEKKKKSLEMRKKDIYLGAGARKQNALFSENLPFKSASIRRVHSLV